MQKFEKMLDEAGDINKEVDKRKKISPSKNYTEISNQVIDDFEIEQNGLNNLFEDIREEKLDLNKESLIKKINQRFEMRFVSKEEREIRIQRAKEVMKYIPLIHVVNSALLAIDNLEELIDEMQIDSNFRYLKRKYREFTNTYEIDRHFNLDKFVFLNFAVSGYLKNGKIAIIAKQDILDREGVLVSLRDIAETQTFVQMKEGTDKRDAVWKQYSEELLRGRDFKELFPSILALSYENPEEFINQLTLAKDIRPDEYEIKNVPIKFEIKIPKSITREDISFIVYIEETMNREKDNKIKNILSNKKGMDILIFPSNEAHVMEKIYKENKRRFASS